MERFAQAATQALNQVLETPITLSDLETPPDPKLGDFGFPCFKLAKAFKKSPPQVAQQIVTDLQTKKAIPKDLQAAAVGPYVNFTVPSEVALKNILKDILAAHYGKLKENSRGCWVLEFSSPNVAKPLNIYHLRPTALGAALDRVGRYRGYQVVSINHLGDWGKQYGMLTVAFQKYGKKTSDSITMKELVEMYVKINSDAEKDPSLENQAREAFLKLEQGDPTVTALWEKCADISIQEFNRMYKRLGVHFDHIWGESYYKDQLKPLLNRLKNQKILEASEGAWIVQVQNRDGKDLTPCIMQKSDGATIYATRDIAAAIYRQDKFKFDRMTYIVGGEQRLHFEQIFGVLRKMGLPWEKVCEHVPTGLYRFKDAKMSTRKGNFVTLEEVLDLAKNRVKDLMQERIKNTDKPEAVMTKPTDEITEAIAIGAVVFHDLHTDPARDVEFDIDRVVDFEGETGPYLQYAHTRCLSILRKAAETQQGDGHFSESWISEIKTPEEVALVKLLGMFPFHLERTLSLAKASQLANYLIDVTKAFGSFYKEHRVLGEASELTAARLMLVNATRAILSQGMELLGIPRPEKM